MTPKTPSRPDGGQYPEATSPDTSAPSMQIAPDEAEEPAPDQTDEEREATDLAGLVQSSAEAQGWTSEIVQSSGPTILGLTSPSGRDFSLTLNPTP